MNHKHSNGKRKSKRETERGEKTEEIERQGDRYYHIQNAKL
jgi:hypothetical protein